MKFVGIEGSAGARGEEEPFWGTHAGVLLLSDQAHRNRTDDDDPS
jgi:hypothetical protein